MQGKTTWVLVANGTRGFIACNLGPGHGLEKDNVREFEGANEAGRDIMADAPGRTFDSGGQGGRHVMEPATDPRRHEHDAFAQQISAYIDDAAKADKFDRLVLVAAPRMLGDLRKHLSKQSRDRVTGEISKDLTAVSRSNLTEHLGEVMAV